MVSKHIELLLLLEVMRTSSIEHVDEDEGDFNLSILLFAMDNLPSIGRAILNKRTTCMHDVRIKNILWPQETTISFVLVNKIVIFRWMPYYETFSLFFFLTVRR